MLQEKSMSKIYGELALLLAVCINSLGVVLMLYSGAGISAISSVPFAFSEVLPHLSLGTWTYLFQGLLILSLMILRKRFVPQYLCSFLVGFVFSELLDVHEAWIEILPTALPWKFLYFAMSYLLMYVSMKKISTENLRWDAVSRVSSGYRGILIFPRNKVAKS